MAYNTYYLRFETQEEAEQKLNEVNYVLIDKETGNTFYRVTDDVGDISIVGEIYNNDSKVIFIEDDPIGYRETPPTKKDGYHVNIIKRGELPEVLVEYVVEPKNPHRVFI